LISGLEKALTQASSGLICSCGYLKRIAKIACKSRLDEQRPFGRPHGVAGQSLPLLKVHAKAIQALSQADSRWYFLPAVELPVILTPGEDGYIVAECPRRPDFSVFPITW